MNTAERGLKPLNRKAYGSIGHILGSRLGPADHSVNEGQTKICTHGIQGKHVQIQTKLDGTCVSVAKLEDGSLVSLVRAGYLARSSPFEMHHMWADWVDNNIDKFEDVLKPGERIVGEWLAQAHGTKYNLKDPHWRQPFIAFDIMVGSKRIVVPELEDRLFGIFHLPDSIFGAHDPETAMKTLDHYGAEEPEGVIYRVESKKNGHYQLDFIAKWVQPNKVDGKYLKGEPVWNWRPE